MDNRPTNTQLLDLIAAPCFCVRDGRILACNAGARGLLLQPGMPIETLLNTGREEYAAFSGGSLYLTLNLEGTIFGATVERKGEADYFLMEEPAQARELRALSLAARDLRAPMAGILATAEELSLQAKDSESARHQLGLMHRSLAQMLRIIGNMSSAGSTMSHPEFLEITGLFREIFEKASSLVAQCGLVLTYAEPDTAIYTLADPQELERAALNLISNAAKFTPKGGAIQVSLTRQGRMLRLTVEDCGTGIPEENRGTLFQRYLRSPSIEDIRQGIGLGMVLVRNAAAHHGGTVLVDCPPQGGTRVCMTLSIRQDIPSGLRSPILRVDYAGERDHALIELADVLPAQCYETF